MQPVPVVTQISTMRAGQLWEPLGVVVAQIVVRLSRAAVFLDKEGYPYWDTEADKDIPPRFAILQAEATLVLERVGVAHLKLHQQKQAWNLIAEAWSLGLQGHHNEALGMIEKAGRLTAQRLTTSARCWLIQAALVGLLLAGGALWLAWHLGAAHDSAYSSITLGVVGAGFSLLSRFNKLAVDAGAGRAAHYWETAARLVVGGVAGYVAQLAAHANLALGELKDSTWGLLFAFLLAGSSERLVPSLLRSNEAEPDANENDAGANQRKAKRERSCPEETEGINANEKSQEGTREKGTRTQESDEKEN